jgi:hypothetical protein
MKSKDPRDTRRKLFEGTVLIGWTDGYEEKYNRGTAMDISDRGLKLLVPEPIPTGEFVTIRSDEVDLAGSARVRHCIRKQGRFLVGLEFTRGLRLHHDLLFAERP